MSDSTSEKFDPDQHIRMATVDDTSRLLRLINLIQPHVPWDETMLAWQFHIGPGGPARVYVVEISDMIVAQYVAVPYPLAIGTGKVRTAWMIQDVMTHPDFRGQGMLHKLGAKALEEIAAAGDYGFTFPNEKSAGSFRRNGWHRLCAVPLRTLLLNGQPNNERSKDSETTRRPIGIELSRINAPSELTIPAMPVQFGVNRNEAYLDWRYSKPGQSYELFRVNHSDATETTNESNAGSDAGYLVLKKYQRDDSLVMHICDVVVCDPELLPLVLDSAIDIATTADASELTAWLPDTHPYAAGFESRGLTFADELPVSIYVTGPDDADAALREPGSWHITQGDSDVY